MFKLFYSGVYASQHCQINKNNIKEKLKNDVRSRLVSNIEDIIFYSENGVHTKNQNVIYMGGFYYEQIKPNQSITEGISQSELSEIDKSDIVIVSLLGDNAIASVTELLYSAFNNKRIELFIKNDINQFNVTDKYWFPIHTAMKFKLMNIHNNSSEDDIVNFILNL